jgi:hypothetical protein
MVTMADLEQARYAGSNPLRPAYSEAAGRWPTPEASDGIKGPDQHSQRQGNLTLVGAVRQWPTWAALNPNDREHPETFLARRELERAKGRNGNGIGLPLAMAARLWATPTAKDGPTPAGTRFGSPDLSHQAREHSTSGRPSSMSSPSSRPPSRPVLNPLFVEWLMGWPIGWTACESPVTGWSRWLRQQRSALWWLVSSMRTGHEAGLPYGGQRTAAGVRRRRQLSDPGQLDLFEPGEQPREPCCDGCGRPESEAAIFVENDRGRFCGDCAEVGLRWPA